MIRLGSGATSGVVIGEDGYVITSSFNFANKPSKTRVTIPGVKGPRAATVVVAVSRTRSARNRS